MSNNPCTQPPALPPYGPSDWTDAVQGNCFTNLQRLGLWTGGITGVSAGQDPSPYFQPVTPGSLGGGESPPTIYVLSHGWAPGYRTTVENAGGNVLWWGSNASANGIWTSDWAWTPVTGVTTPLPVNQTGFLQSIVALDPNAIVLAWSWIDDSATDTGDIYLYEVYRSEAYTHVNGIRLANALEQAIAPSFWNTHTGLLRLIGHSHGSKVATVAALTLQERGRRVAHLTILDSPESEATLLVNGSNLNGFYLEQMQIANPSFDCAAGAFVDNYVSYFGVGYTGTSNLTNIVDVKLDPSKLYEWYDPGDQHSYAAAWYGGAAAGAAAQQEAPLGLAWPPPPNNFRPGLNQNWPNGVDEYNQWQLQLGKLNGESYAYSTTPLTVQYVYQQGNVQGDPSTKLTFGPNNGAFSLYEGSYHNHDLADSYGMAIDILWTAPQVGDYLVVTMASPDLHLQETLLVMDGQSAPAGKTSVAINSNARDWIGAIDIYIFFYAAPGNRFGQVVMSNFRLVEVTSSTGYLQTKRLADAAAKSAQRALEAPKVVGGPESERRSNFANVNHLSSPEAEQGSRHE